MKGNEKIIKRLNVLLADELTAIGQYMVHSEMCANWGYGKLHNVIKARAIGEMKHAEKLIERILFLEGSPDVSGMQKVLLGNDVEQQFKNDRDAETVANKAYNDGIRLCYELNDNGTMELLKSILTDEEKHLDWLETQLSLIKQIGSKNYLIEQVE
jgi:bacterioferritin